MHPPDLAKALEHLLHEGAAGGIDALTMTADPAAKHSCTAASPHEEQFGWIESLI